MNHTSNFQDDVVDGKTRIVSERRISLRTLFVLTTAYALLLAAAKAAPTALAEFCFGLLIVTTVVLVCGTLTHLLSPEHVSAAESSKPSKSQFASPASPGDAISSPADGTLIMTGSEEGRIQPSSLLIIVSLGVLAVCLPLIALALSAFTVTWDLGAILGGIVLFPLSILLAIQQYRGTFRQVRSAAYTSGVLLTGVAGLMALGVITTLGDFINSGIDVSCTSLILPMAAIAAGGLLAGWLNLRWAYVLPTATHGRPAFHVTLKELFGAVTAVALIAVLAGAFIHSAAPQYAVGVGIADAPFGLPPEATNISFCQGGRGSIAYEFTISEPAFRQWVDAGIGSLEARAANVPLLPITSPVTITRFPALAWDLPGPTSVTVKAGLFYLWTYEDRAVHAVFDSTTNRAYYYAHFH